MKRAYVYIVFDRNGIPRYVGKGNGQRWKLHNWGWSHNKILAGMIRDAAAEFPVIIIRENLSDEEAFEIEVAFIKAIGRIEFGGPLVNLTDGGEGVQNISAATRARLSEIAKERQADPAYREAMRQKMLEFWSDPATIMFKGNRKGCTLSAETKALIGSKAKERMSDPVRRKAKSIEQTGRIPSAETLEKRSVAMRAYWQDRRERGLPTNHPARDEAKRREKIKNTMLKRFAKLREERDL
jgi:hypothetical protein